MKTKPKSRVTTRAVSKVASKKSSPKPKVTSNKKTSSTGKVGILGWLFAAVIVGFVGWAVSKSNDFKGAEAGVDDKRVYISDSGDDKNPGNPTMPKRTFASAMDSINQSKGAYTGIGVLGESYTVTATDVMDMPTDQPIKLDVGITQPIVVSGYKQDLSSASLAEFRTSVIQTIGGGSLTFQITRGALTFKGLDFQTVNGVFVNVLDQGKLVFSDNTFTRKDFNSNSTPQLAVQQFQKGTSSIQNNKFWIVKKVDTISSLQATGLSIMGGSGNSGYAEAVGNSFYFPMLDQIQELTYLSDLQAFPNIGISAYGDMELSIKSNKFMIDRSKYPTGTGGPKSPRNIGIMMPANAKSHIDSNIFSDFYGTPIVTGALSNGNQYIGIMGSKK